MTPARVIRMRVCEIDGPQAPTARIEVIAYLFCRASIAARINEHDLAWRHLNHAHLGRALNVIGVFGNLHQFVHDSSHALERGLKHYTDALPGNSGIPCTDASLKRVHGRAVM